METNRTHLDEIIKIPLNITAEMYKNQSLVSFVINVPDADLSSEETETKFYDVVFDYQYVDGLVQENISFICIDTVIPTPLSGTIKDIYIEILVGVNKSIMEINEFKGVAGNRRDNIVREIDFSLRDKNKSAAEINKYGIGALELISIDPVTIAGKGYSCKLMKYKIPTFALSSNIKR